MNGGIDYFSKGHPFSRYRSHHAWKAREKMLAMFLKHAAPSAQSTILDLGVTPDTTLAESNHFEKRYPWPTQITAASIEPIDGLKKIHPQIKFEQIQPGALPYPSRTFDCCFSSAVIEHVGDRENQLEFIKEISRVSDFFFITTPNRWFPLDFHTITPLIHWLPRKQHQRILRWMGKEFWSKTENLNLLGAKDLEILCQEACPEFSVEIGHVSLMGWPSNLLAWGRRKCSKTEA